MVQQVEQRAGVDRSRTAGHRHPLERREAHRGVPRAAAGDRGHRATSSQVADDQPQLAEVPFQQARRPLERPLQRQPVKAVAANVELVPPPAGDGVGRGNGRHRGVKRGVEHGDLRYRGKPLPGLVEGPKGGEVVQRGDLLELLQPCPHRLVDHHRRDERVTAVHHSMGDRRHPAVPAHRRQRRGGLRPFPPVDQMQLEAGGTGVDDQDVAGGAQNGHAQSRISG